MDVNVGPWTRRLLGAAAASLCVSIIAAVLASAFIIRESYRMHCIGPAQEEQSSEQSRNSSRKHSSERREEHTTRWHMHACEHYYMNFKVHVGTDHMICVHVAQCRNPCNVYPPEKH